MFCSEVVDFIMKPKGTVKDSSVNLHVGLLLDLKEKQKVNSLKWHLILDFRNVKVFFKKKILLKSFCVYGFA